MKAINRVPRALGTTYLSRKYNKSQSEEDYQNLVKHTLYYYLLDGFSLNGKFMTLQEFSSYLSIPLNKVMSLIPETAKNTINLVSQNNIEEMYLAISNLSLNWSMEDRGRILSQFHLLNNAQNNTYKPFISSEVNKTLDLLMKSNNQLATNLKQLFTSSQTNINIFTPKEKNEESLSTEKAIELINKDKEFMALSSSQNHILSLLEKHQINPISEIIEGNRNPLPIPISLEPQNPQKQEENENILDVPIRNILHHTK